MGDWFYFAIFGWLMAGLFLLAFLATLSQRDDLLVEVVVLRRLKAKFYNTPHNTDKGNGHG